MIEDILKQFRPVSDWKCEKCGAKREGITFEMMAGFSGAFRCACGGPLVLDRVHLVALAGEPSLEEKREFVRDNVGNNAVMLAPDGRLEAASIAYDHEEAEGTVAFVSEGCGVDVIVNGRSIAYVDLYHLSELGMDSADEEKDEGSRRYPQICLYDLDEDDALLLARFKKRGLVVVSDDGWGPKPVWSEEEYNRRPESLPEMRRPDILKIPKRLESSRSDRALRTRKVNT